MEFRRIARAGLAGLPVALGFLSLIDPRTEALRVPAVLLAFVMLGIEAREKRPTTVPAGLLLLTSIFAIIGWSEPRWCCDASPYYMYARSAIFDHDFDFMNEWAAFGDDAPELTDSGKAMNKVSVGPAILWTPFILLAHAYVLLTRALGLSGYAPTGYSTPYLMATAAGTAVAVTAGIMALWRVCVRHFPGGAGPTAVVLGLLASVLPYYLFVVPSVSHGPVFAASALFLAAWLKVERAPSLKGWLTLAALLGVVSLFRWQAVLLGIMFVPLFFDGWRRGIARWWWAPLSVLTSALVFAPQAGMWWLLFEGTRAGPAAIHGMDWAAPSFLRVLISADRGLFTWSPVLVFGCAGWVLLSRRLPAFAWTAWAVFLATTWVNGSVAGRWWGRFGGDSFGARRFDLLIPLWIFGLAAAIHHAARWVRRRPVAAPAAALSLLVLWNLGLVELYRSRAFTDAAPLEDLAARQALLLRRMSENGLGFLAGVEGRNLAYMAFVGRYFYQNTGFDGRIDLTQPTVRFLSGDWSDRMLRDGFGAFRFASRSGSCIKVPFEAPLDLRVAVTARSMVQDQVMVLVANGRPVAQARDLPMEWSEARFLVPSALMVPGENLLCLGFSGAEKSGPAAAVRRIQLP